MLFQILCSICDTGYREVSKQPSLIFQDNADGTTVLIVRYGAGFELMGK